MWIRVFLTCSLLACFPATAVRAFEDEEPPDHKLLSDAEVRDALPPRLKKLLLNAPSPRTSQIEWTLSHFGGYDDGLVERYITRTVGDTLWESNLGDANGFHRIAFVNLPPKGTPLEDLAKYMVPREEDAGTRNKLIFEGDVWYISKAERPFSGSVTSLDERSGALPNDFAAAGIMAGTEFGTGVLGVWPLELEKFPSAEFSSERLGSLDVVTAEWDNRRLEWHLDTKKGGLPVYAAFYRGDRLSRWSETEYSRIDGEWFPASTRFFRHDEETPRKVIDVQSATFDEPWHMQEIVPEDIGVLFGTQLVAWPGGHKRWDGTRLLTADEYNELVYIYGVRPDPRITEHLAELVKMTVEEYSAWVDATAEWQRDKYYKKHGEAPWLALESPEKDEWDLYVEDFIKRHKLDEPRVKSAEALLKRAKGIRDAHIRRNLGEIRRAQRRGDQEKLAVHEAYKKRVFDRILVRGLERLIPRKK